MCDGNDMRDARRGSLAGREGRGRGVRCKDRHGRRTMDSGGALDVFMGKQRSQSAS
jgi:hypothetical protein